MPRPLKIYIKNIDKHVEIEGGTTLQEALALLPENALGFRPICALVNGKTEPLDFPVYRPKQVEYIPVKSSTGRATYRRSLTMILYKAFLDLYPGSKLRIEHEVSGGYYCLMSGAAPKITQEVTDAVKARMREIVDADMPFELREELTTDVVKIFEERDRTDEVSLLSSQYADVYTVYYKLGDVCDIFPEALAPSTGHISVFDLHPFHEGMLLMPPKVLDPTVPVTMKKQEKLMRAYQEYVAMNKIIGTSNIADMNKVVNSQYVAQFVTIIEALHDQHFAKIAAEIAERHRQGGARVVLIAGPSSSGKTTSSMRLAVQLYTNCIVPKVIGLDNYFLDREQTPRDESGDHDYESLYALDLKQLNTDIKRLIAGETVPMPTFNFKEGKREYLGNTLRLGPNDVLLMEGIHGLNPDLTPYIPQEMIYKVFVSALTTISIDDHNWVSAFDNRLLRRIIRDHKYRGTSAQETIRRWPSVRRGEEKWIFPYQENADATINSSLLFEIAMIKPYAEAVLRQVPPSAKEFNEAHRLLRFLRYFQSVPDADVPSTSILREFIGGSVFNV